MRKFIPIRPSFPSTAHIACVCAVFWLFWTASIPVRADVPTDARATITIATAHGPVHFLVEIADTEEKRELGLMYRFSMPADSGMLFLFGTPQPVKFWMKNTLIPLDMLFIAANGRIANIAERAVPLSEATIPSSGPVVSVVEVNGGTAHRLGIQAGDLVEGAVGAAP
jgi:uncharacterized membrane protein (UPF0127 family)